MAAPSGLHRAEVPRSIVRRVRRDAPLVLLDLAIVLSAYLSTLVLRLEGAVPANYWRNFWVYLPLIASIHLAANHVFGLYGQMWRYASVLEARRVVLAGLTAGGFIVAAVTLSSRGLRPLPLSVAILGSVLALIGFGAVRFQSRLFAFRRREFIGDRVRVLVIGAGDAGAMILKDILREPVGRARAGRCRGRRPAEDRARALRGTRWWATHADIPALVERLDVDQVLLAIPSASCESDPGGGRALRTGRGDAAGPALRSGHRRGTDHRARHPGPPDRGPPRATAGRDRPRGGRRDHRGASRPGHRGRRLDRLGDRPAGRRVLARPS